jgi:hypothetical protein
MTAGGVGGARDNGRSGVGEARQKKVYVYNFTIQRGAFFSLFQFT